MLRLLTRCPWAVGSYEFSWRNTELAHSTVGAHALEESTSTHSGGESKSYHWDSKNTFKPEFSAYWRELFGLCDEQFVGPITSLCFSSTTICYPYVVCTYFRGILVF